MHDAPIPIPRTIPPIVRPYVFESLEWLRCGMTTRAALEPDEERMALARRLPEMAGLAPAAVVVGEQVHGDAIALVGGDQSETPQPLTGEVVDAPGVDALVTIEPNVALGVFTADCVPVILVDRRTRALAAVHAGREGTLRSIARKSVERLVDMGSDPEDLIAWIAPSVSIAHYEVSEEIAAEFRSHFSHYPGAIQGPELRHLALGLINWCELISCGIPRSQIELDARCTFDLADLFFSYRRDGADSGRMLTFACAMHAKA